jgi:hypothetical protein
MLGQNWIRKEEDFFLVLLLLARQAMHVWHSRAKRGIKGGLLQDFSSTFVGMHGGKESYLDWRNSLSKSITPTSTITPLGTLAPSQKLTTAHYLIVSVTEWISPGMHHCSSHTYANCPAFLISCPDGYYMVQQK